MLGYEWGNNPSPPPPQPPPQLMIYTDDDINQQQPPSSAASSTHHHHRPIFHDTFSTFPHDTPSSSSSSFSLYQHHSQQFPLFNDPRAFPSAYEPPPSLFTPPENISGSGAGYPLVVPKTEPEYTNRIGLNLGGRTYFAADDSLVSRLYRRSRPAEPVNAPRCQAEGCHADLSNAKHYHRRHKVCEFHSKASTVIAAGLTQRFCQQCSRFHLLSEFDNGKRSCRKRLADHNRRRRKSHQRTPQDHRTSSPSENTPNSSSQIFQRSSSDSGANSLSSVTVAVSSPRVSFDSNFRQRSYDLDQANGGFGYGN